MYILSPNYFKSAVDFMSSWKSFSEIVLGIFSSGGEAFFFFFGLTIELF